MSEKTSALKGIFSNTSTELDPGTNLPKSPTKGPNDPPIAPPKGAKKYNRGGSNANLWGGGVNSVSDIFKIPSETGKMGTPPTIFPGPSYYDLPDVDFDIYDRGTTLQRRASRQGVGEQILGALNQAVFGEVLGGTIEAIGAVADFAWGGIGDTYGNWMTELGSDIRNFTKEITPIYQMYPGMGWNPSDSGWWAQNAVSVASTLSLLIPARGVQYAGGKLMMGIAKGTKKINKAKKGTKLHNFAKKIENAAHGTKWTRAAGTAVLGGTASRFMENYREAAETGVHSLEKNLKFLSDPENLEEFLNSEEGQIFLEETGITRNDPNIVTKAAQYASGKAASHAFKIDWANWAFDVFQYGLMFSPGLFGKIGTRTGKGSSAATKAQQGFLKAPKKVKSPRFGRLGAAFNWTVKKGKPFAKWAAWSATEGIEEMVNYIGMQEGIRKGDLILGNTGYTNKEYIESDDFLGRLDHYMEQGGFWTSAMWGAIGGGIFTGVAGIRNRNYHKKLAEQKVQEIGERTALITELMQERQRYEAIGDIDGMRKIDQQLAIELALKAAAVGNVDLLLEMINDPMMDEALESGGMKKEDIQAKKKEIIETVELVEKLYNSRMNTLTGDRYSDALGASIVRMEMNISMYQNLIDEINKRIEAGETSDVVLQDGFKIGSNTKNRYDLQRKIQEVNKVLQMFEQIRSGLEKANAEAGTSEKDKQQNSLALEETNKQIEKYKQQLSEIEKKSTLAKKDSQDNYDAGVYKQEEDFLKKVQEMDQRGLAEKKALYTNLRDLSWEQLNRMLTGETTLIDKDKKEVGKASVPKTEQEAIEDSLGTGTEQAKQSAQTRAKIQDLRNFIIKNKPSLKALDDFIAQYPTDQEFQRVAALAREAYAQYKNEQDFRDKNDSFRSKLKKVIKEETDEIKDYIDEANKKFLEELDKLTKPKTSMKDVRKGVETEIWYRNWIENGALRTYGIKESQDYLINELFDEFTPVISVVWKGKVGSLFIDPETNEYIFRHGRSGKETIIPVEPETASNKYRNSKGQYTKGATLRHLDMRLLKNSYLNMSIIADGRTIMINGEYYNILDSDPSSAIKYNKKTAEVLGVHLTKWDGTKVFITTPGLKYEIANIIETLEAVKRIQFKNLVQNDFMIIEHEGTEYIVQYENAGMKGLFQDYQELTVRLEDGTPASSDIKKEVLKIANQNLTKAIEQEINNIKVKYNEARTSNNVTPAKNTETTLESTPEQEGKISEDPGKVKQITQSEINSEKIEESSEGKKEELNTKEEKDLANGARNSIEQNSSSITEEENQKDTKEEETQNTEKTKKKLEEVVGLGSQHESNESTTPEDEMNEDQNTLGLISSPTDTDPDNLDAQYPSGFITEMAWINIGTKENPLIVNLLDGNGNLIGNRIGIGTVPYIDKTIEEMSNLEKSLLEAGNARIVKLYHWKPVESNVDGVMTVLTEGSRAIVDESQLKELTNDEGKPLFRIWKTNTVKVSDYISTDVLNNPKFGVGTKIILRVEPTDQFFSSNEPNKVTITLRLASNPSIILTKRQGVFEQDGELYDQVKSMLESGDIKDIEAEVTGKTNGYVINIKRNGKSVESSLNTLEGQFPLILGYAQGDVMRIEGEEYQDIIVPDSPYYESGATYLIIPASNGTYIPVRLNTQKLTDFAAERVLEIILSETTNPEQKRAQVNKIVNVYSKVTSDKVLALDNYEFKFKYGDFSIGIQYNMEGSGKNAKNNLKNAIEGKPFHFKLYDEFGIQVSKGEFKDGDTIKQKTLRESSELNINENGPIKEAIIEHLKTKYYNIQKNELNSDQKFISPLKDGKVYKNYLEYLSDPELKIITHDIPSGSQTKFFNTKVFFKLTSKPIKATSKKKSAPSFLSSNDTKVINSVETENENISEIPTEYDEVKGKVKKSGRRKYTITEEADNSQRNPNVETFDPTKLAGKKKDSTVESSDNLSDNENNIISDKSKEREDNKSDDNFDVQLRQRYETDPASDILSEKEVQWFKDKFGEEGLEIAQRIKYIILKDGRMAYGKYHKGMVTLAQFGKEGTAYWEAMRRIMDLHLTPEEKNDLTLAAINRWNDTDQKQVEINIARGFMEFMLTENDSSLSGILKRFFRSLLYYIKNMLGMKPSIDQMFKDLSNRTYTKYNVKELNELSQVQNVAKLREKKNYTELEVEDITSSINFMLWEHLNNKYGDNWVDILSKPVELAKEYEKIRISWRNKSEERLKDPNLSEPNRRIHSNILDITDESVFYTQFEKVGKNRINLENVTDVGFRDLAVEGLIEWGYKFKFKKDFTLDYDSKPEITEAIPNEEEVSTEDIGIEDIEKLEKIYGMNFWYQDQRSTLSKEVKIGLSFIKSRERSNITGSYKFIPFDDIYNYISAALSNVPQKYIESTLRGLQNKTVNGQNVMPSVIRVFDQASDQWKRKFLTHFNKQNILFKTLVIEGGKTKTVFTNRNGIHQQIMNEWIAARGLTSIFTERVGKPDEINIEEVEKIWSKTKPDIFYDQLMPIYQKYIKLLGNQSEQTKGKEEYLKVMTLILEKIGITIPKDVQNGIINDEKMNVKDLHSYMTGTNSVSYMFTNKLLKGLSPYIAENLEGMALGRLAELVAQYRVDKYLSSFIGGNRKPIFSINLNTFGSDRVNLLTDPRTSKQTIDEYLSDSFYNPVPDNNNYMHLILRLLQIPEVRDKFVLSTFDVIQERGEFQAGKTYDELTEAVSWKTRYAMFYNNGLPFAEINTGTKSDKTNFQFVLVPKINYMNRRLGLWTSPHQENAKTFVDTAIELLYPLALAEYNNIIRTENELFGPTPISPREEIKNVHYKDVPGDRKGNGLRFSMLDILNDSQYEIFTPEGRLKRPSNGMTHEDMNRIHALMKTGIKNFVLREVNKTLDSMSKSGVVNKVKEGHYTNNGLPSETLAGRVGTENNIYDSLVGFAINDLVYKNYLSTIFGPPAFYYKNIVDKMKRGYQDVTPGYNVIVGKNGMKSKFNHVTLRDIYKQRPENVTRIKKILTDAGVSNKVADRISQAYASVIKTDGQGYVTLEFYKQILESTGQWSPQHQEYYEKYWVTGKKMPAEARDLLLDPLKTFYFGPRVHTNSLGNTRLRWEQLKHSVVPLLREWTETTKQEGEFTLNNLRQRMEGVGQYNGFTPIDMVDFESGVKVGANGLTEFNRPETWVVEQFETKNLRLPQLIKTKVKDPLDGTQWAKLILENLSVDNNYTIFEKSFNGEELRKLYNDIYAEKIKRSSEKLMKRIGWNSFKQKWENRDELINTPEFAQAQLEFLKKVRAIIEDGLTQRNMSGVYFDALDLREVNDMITKFDFTVPLAFPTFAKTFENLLNSVVKNNVLKQRVHGMSAVQVAEFGSGVGQFTDELQIKRSPSGGIYAEARLSYDIALKLGYQGKVGEIKGIDKNILEVLGYRIPTQGKNSMISLKVIEILPSTMGSIIQVPSELTTMMGQDFDIDKLYLMFPERTKTGTKIGAFSYDTYLSKGRSFDGIGEQSLNNALFDIRKAILESKHTAREILDPLDTTTYEEKIREYERLGIIQKLQNLAANATSTDVFFEMINKDANMLIGLFSLHATGHAMAQEMGLELDDFYSINININGNESLTDLSRIFDYYGGFISTNISEDQNESLDNGTKQQIGRVGINVYNHGVKALLTRAGIPGGIAIDFINQQIIREYLELRQTQPETVSELELAERLAAKYKVAQEFQEARKGARFFTPTPKSLTEGLSLDLKDRENAIQQIQLLSDFLKYQKVGKDLSKFNKMVSPETLKNTSRMSFFEEWKRIEEYLNSEDSSLRWTKGKTARLEAYEKYGVDAALDLVGHFLPYNTEAFLALKDKISEVLAIRDGILKPDQIDVINSLALYWLFTQRTEDNPLHRALYATNEENAITGEYNSSLISKRLFSKKESLASELLKLKKDYPELRNDILFGLLFPHRDNAIKSLQLIAFNNSSKLSPIVRSRISNRWNEILNLGKKWQGQKLEELSPLDRLQANKDLRLQKFGLQLAAYSIITSGFMMGPNSFIDLLPISYLEGAGFTSFFRKQIRGLQDPGFFGDHAVDQIIRNIFKDKGLVHSVKWNSLQKPSLKGLLSFNKNTYFVRFDSNKGLKQHEDPSTAAKYIKAYHRDTTGKGRGKWRLFRMVGNPQQNGAYYEEISPLGERWKFVELFEGGLKEKSVHPENTTRFNITQENDIRDNTTEGGNPNNVSNFGESMGLFRIAPMFKQSIIKDLDNRLIEWVQKHYGFSIQEYNNLKKRLGIDAVGMADLLNRTLYLSSSRDRLTVPEEVGHVFIASLPENIQREIASLAGQTKLHQEVAKEYANVYQTPLQFQLETAGKLLGMYITQQETGETLKIEEAETPGLLGALKRAWNWLWNNIFKLFNKDIARTELEKNLDELFGPMASKIYMGMNPTEINKDASAENLKTFAELGINKFYNLNKAADNMKSKIINAVNNVQTFVDETGRKVDQRLSNDSVSDLINREKERLERTLGWKKSDFLKELLKESEGIRLPEANGKFYTMDGIKLHRVSDVIQLYQQPFEEAKFASLIAVKNKREGNEFNTKDRVLKLWEFLRKDVGTGIHTALESIINNKDPREALTELNLNPISKAAILNNLQELKDWVNKRKAAGSKLHAEVKIGDKIDLIGGTIDVLEQTSNGRIILHDWKTKMLGKFVTLNQKLPAFKEGPLSGLPNTKLNQYRLQLSLYKHIIEQKGLKVDDIQVHGIEVDTQWSENGIFFNNIKFLSDRQTAKSTLKNIKPVKSYIITNIMRDINPRSTANVKKEIDNISKVADILAEARNNILTKIAAHKKTGDKTYRASLESLLTKLDELSERQGIAEFMKQAVRDINLAHKRLLELQEKSAINAKDLIAIRNFVGTYDILDRMLLMLPTLVETDQIKEIENFIAPAIAKRQMIDSLFLELGIPLVASLIMEKTTNPDMTLEKVTKQLTEASRDIGYLERWLDALGDSNDTILANVDKIIKDKRGEVQRFELDLIYGSDTQTGLYDMLKELEDYQKAQGKNVNHFRELYDFMLERDSKGELTGGIVQKTTKEWRDKVRVLIENAQKQNRKPTKREWAEFYDKNPIEINSQYTSLMNLSENDTRRTFYKYWVDTYQSAQKQLPAHMRKAWGGFMLPSIRATHQEQLLEKKGGVHKKGLAAVKEVFTEHMAIHEDDVHYGQLLNEKGEPLDFVPIHYNRLIGTEEDQLHPEDVTYDLASQLRMYTTMATNFAKMQEVLPELEIIKQAIKTRRVVKNWSGKPVIDPVTEQPVTTPGIQSHAYNRLIDYFDMVIYGKRKAKGNVREIAGKKITSDKISDSFLGYNALRVLALNKWAGMANIGMGTLMNWIEGFSAQFVTIEDLTKATSTYYGDSKGIIDDILQRRPSSKTGLLNEEYNVLQNFDEFGKRIDHRNIGLRSLHLGASFFMMSAGEHMIQSKLAQAFMHNKKFKISGGKEISLYDAYTVKNGRLVLNKEVAEQWSDEDRVRFSEKIQAVYQRMHGIYNTADKAALQKYAIGRWVIQFRKWMRPGYMRRFGGIEKMFYDKESEFKNPEWNERFDSYWEGNYVTTFKFFKQLASEAVKGKFQAKLNWKDLSPWQKANLKRAFGEVNAFSILMLASYLLLPEGDDKDDAPWNTIYVLKRVQQELGFFMWMPNTIDILKAPAASITTIEVFFKFLEQLADPTEQYERKTGKYEKGDYKIEKRFKDLLPFKELWTRSEDKLKWFDLK